MLILDDNRTWPRHIVEQLEAEPISSILKKLPSMELIRRGTKFTSEFKTFFEDVNNYAREVGIAGYHCTKQLKDLPFAEAGLRVLDLREHHQEFLEYVKSNELLDERLFKRMKKELKKFRKTEKDGGREKQLCFLLNRYDILSEANEIGIQNFLTFFGGEAIYTRFYQHIETAGGCDELEQIGLFLKNLGDPTVIKLHLKYSKIEGIHRSTLGVLLAGYFAKSLHPSFDSENNENDGFTSVDIPKERLTVYPLAKFKALYEQEISNNSCVTLSQH